MIILGRFIGSERRKLKAELGADNNDPGNSKGPRGTMEMEKGAQGRGT